MVAIAAWACRRCNGRAARHHRPAAWPIPHREWRRTSPGFAPRSASVPGRCRTVLLPAGSPGPARAQVAGRSRAAASTIASSTEAKRPLWTAARMGLSRFSGKCIVIIATSFRFSLPLPPGVAKPDQCVHAEDESFPSSRFTSDWRCARTDSVRGPAWPMAMAFSAPPANLVGDQPSGPAAQQVDWPLSRGSWSGQCSGARTIRARRVSRARKSSRFCSLAS